MELAYTLAQDLEPKGIGVADISLLGCWPAAGIKEDDGYCGKWTDEALQELAQDRNIKYVVVAYRTIHWTNTLPEAHVPAAIQRIIARISKSKKVIFVIQAPELPKPVQELALLEQEDGRAIIGQTRSEWLAERESFDREFDRGNLQNVEIIDPVDQFCDSQFCYAGRNGQAFYHDDNHPSLGGAELIAARILPLILDGQPG